MSDHEPIKAALDRACKTVTLKPSVGQRTYSGTAEVTQGLACTIREGDFQLLTDVPKGMGGSHAGPSPSILFRGAVASCLAIGIKMWAARAGLEIDTVRVCVETGVDARGQLGVASDARPGFDDLRAQIEIRSAAAEDDLLDAVGKSIDFSPMIDVIGGPKAIRITTKIAAPAA